MTSRERVLRAIGMNNPDRVPILFFNKDKEESDILMIDVVRHFTGPREDESEWGFRWEKLDDTMGQPREPVLKTWEGFDDLRRPDASDTSRFADVKNTMIRHGKDKYYLASLVLTGFTVMTFLRGFAATLEDFYANRADLEKLAEIVFGFEEDIIRQCAAYGFDGVAFFDDWGTQTNLIISPSLWREFFKPRYKKQFDLVHACGLTVYYHCCGYILDIIPDFIEIGVDMLNLSQPNIFDIEDLGRMFGGKICFVCPVSYQTTSLSGTKEDIFEEAHRLFGNLGGRSGGFIGYVEEYHSIGMSDDNYRYCVEAFRSCGRSAE